MANHPQTQPIRNPIKRNPEGGRRAAHRTDPFDGILLVDKPSGYTSHDVVAKLRHHFRLRKVGHGGTLDPMATGLLIILLGRGTKLSQRIMGTDKDYEGAMKLGVTTDTQDADGIVLEEKDSTHITREQLRTEMEKRRGDQMQTPPMVSAIKKNGVPLYKLARKGREVERDARLIHVYRFDLLDFDPPHARFHLKCTKGTYVRTLCADIGDALACGAHLAELRRTGIGNLHVDHARKLDDLLNESLEQLGERVIPLHAFAAE